MSSSALVLGAVLSVGSSSDATVLLEAVLNRPDVLRLTVGERRYEQAELSTVHHWALHELDGDDPWILELGSARKIRYEGRIAYERGSAQNIGIFVRAPTDLGPSQRIFATMMRHHPDRVILETDSRQVVFQPLMPSSRPFDWERWLVADASTLSDTPRWAFEGISLDSGLRLVSGRQPHCAEPAQASSAPALRSGKNRLCVLGPDGPPMVSIELGGEGAYVRSSVDATPVIHLGGGDPGLTPPSLLARATRWTQEYHFGSLQRATDGWRFEVRGMEDAPIDAFRLEPVMETFGSSADTRGLWLTVAGLHLVLAFVLFLVWTVRGSLRRST
jgi:hypothetical protein